MEKAIVKPEGPYFDENAGGPLGGWWPEIDGEIV